MSDVRTRVYGSAERLLNRMASLAGQDRELSELSTKITALKTSAYSDKRLSPAELTALQQKMADIEAAFTQFASERGYPVGNQRPADPKSFRIYQEQQEIHYQWLAGKDLRGGALGQLNDAMKDRSKVLSSLMFRSNMNPSKLEWATLPLNARICVRRGQVLRLSSEPRKAPFGCSGRDNQKPFSSEPAATLSM
jgi:hypothetical protein